MSRFATSSKSQPESLHPVTRAIIGGATDLRGRRIPRIPPSEGVAERDRAGLGLVDILVTPTAGTMYTIAEVEADPIRTNSNLGYYTNFMNLLDLSAIAVPAGFQANRLPFGITLIAPAFADEALCALGDAAQRAAVNHDGGKRQSAACREDRDSPRMLSTVDDPGCGMRRAHVGPAAQSPAHRARRAACVRLPHGAALSLIRADRVRAAASGHGASR